MYIGGEWLAAEQGAPTFAVDNPATNERIAVLPDATAAQAEAAITAASHALTGWRSRTGKDRSVILRRWFDLITSNADMLAGVISEEEGKPLTEAKAEVAYGASFVEWFAEQAKRVDGDILQSPRLDQRLLVLRQAVGVCAAITPWNFPLAMITRKAAPALAAGCTIVVKPAEQTPLTALALACLAHEAGIPPGVLNILTASASSSIEVGKVLTGDPCVRHVSFTGSTEVGRILMAQCAPTIKKISLELGGHAPFIVFDDADLEKAVDGALAAKYRNAGQACIAPNRFYVQQGISERFINEIARRSASLRVGPATDREAQIGPLIDGTAIEKVQQHVQDARDKGAVLVTGGHVLEGRFYAPSVLSGITPDMLMSREETFGPVIGVTTFADETELLALANHPELGLAAYLFSRDISRVWRIAEALEFGMIGVNTGSISNEVAPFGGVKQSGLGREGSKYGIDEYLEMKYVCLDMT